MKSKAQALYASISAPKNTGEYKYRILVGTPTLGQIRIEWHNAMNGIVVPVNWSNAATTPIGFHTDDGQNLVCKEVVEKHIEWMLLIEDDVVVPPDIFKRFGEHMRERKSPIISGLYCLKGSPEPLIFRGRGTGSFRDFKIGNRVWVDGVPTGCLLVHNSIISLMWDESEEYDLVSNGVRTRVRRIFHAPRIVISEPSLRTYRKLLGTSDLSWCDRIMKENVLKRAGWPYVAKRKWPFLADTSIHCGHVDRETGQVFYWGGKPT